MEINMIEGKGVASVVPNNDEIKEKDNSEKVALAQSEFDKQQSSEGYSEETLKGDVEKVNKVVELYNKELKFMTHKASNRTMVEVVNANTKEVIREIPPKEFLDWVGKFHALIGAMIDKTI